MTTTNTLQALGWQSTFAENFASYAEQGYTVGRVALEHKHIYRVYTENGDVLAEVAGKLRFNALGREDYPAVGDWVVISEREGEGKAIIHAVLPRKSKFSRKAAGNTTVEQIVASNVDTIFLVTALNKDFNVRRIERYLIMAWESGASPVIILSKADLCDDVEEKKAAVEAVAFGIPVHVVSAEASQGLEQLEQYLQVGSTIALMGSSGVGKSTLVNYLFGREVLLTKEIREGDDKGKHTTTHRELVVRPEGGLLIDTPGMRELQLWSADEGFQDSFQDIESAAEHCQFRDCQHENEPNCAVRAGLQAGTIDRGRFENYRKMQRELAYLARKEDKRAQLVEKQRWKQLHKDARKRIRF